MADFLHDITVTDTSKIDLGNVYMITEAQLLEEVVVRAGFAIRMRGDTLEYNADSFAVKPGSNVEELLKRLPGIEVEKDGKIKAQGQEVQKVLVDGDEFFSDDPGLAMKYLRPAPWIRCRCLTREASSRNSRVWTMVRAIKPLT